MGLMSKDTSGIIVIKIIRIILILIEVPGSQILVGYWRRTESYKRAYSIVITDPIGNNLYRSEDIIVCSKPLKSRITGCIDVLGNVGFIDGHNFETAVEVVFPVSIRSIIDSVSDLLIHLGLAVDVSFRTVFLESLGTMAYMQSWQSR
jgi:hypothetical protein